MTHRQVFLSFIHSYGCGHNRDSMKYYAIQVGIPPQIVIDRPYETKYCNGIAQSKYSVFE